MAISTETEAPQKPINGKNQKGWTNWPSVFKAARVLGLRVPQVRILVTTGDLPSFEAPDGTTRFDPEVLRELRPEVSHLTDEDFDASIAVRKAEQEALDHQAERQGMPVEAIRSQHEFNRTILNHNKELHCLVKEMIEDSRKTITVTSQIHEAVIKRQGEQLAHYHEMFDALIRAREDQLSQQTERDLALLQEKDRIARRQDVLTIAKDQAGKLVSIVAAKLGVSDTALKAMTANFDASKLQAFVKFFESLEPDQVDVAMASGFFSSEQVEQLSVITGRPAPISPITNTESESSCESPPVESPSQSPPTP